MKKILLLQFRTDSSASHERDCFCRFAKNGDVEISHINSTDESINWNDPEDLLKDHHAVILGGSGEFCFSGRNNEDDEKFKIALKNTSPMVRFLIESDFPTLGICFGHQMLGHHLGVKVHKDESQAKTGSFDISLTEEGKNDDLFKDLPEFFTAQYGHKDSLEKLPENSKLLVLGENCKTSAFKHKNNIYGVQFHPEMNMNDLISKMDIYSDYITNREYFLNNLKDSPHSPKIIENFIEKIA